MFHFFFSLLYQFNINYFPWRCLCGAGGAETWAIGTETKAIWKFLKETKPFNRKYLKSKQLRFPSPTSGFGARAPSARGRGSAGLPGSPGQPAQEERVPKAPRPAPCQGSPASLQQSHSPGRTLQTGSASRSRNHGSKTKASPRNIPLCSLLPTTKFSRHVQTLQAI